MNNPERAIKSVKKYLSSSKGKAWYRSWYEKYRTTEAYKKSWQKANVGPLSKARHARHRAKRDLRPECKIIQSIRNSIHQRIKAPDHSSKYLDATVADLRKHIESLWLPGMSWDNYGINGWHIDHIKPLARYNFFKADGTVNVEEIKSAMSLRNLQPLWASDNIKKKDKWPVGQEKN